MQGEWIWMTVDSEKHHVGSFVMKRELLTKEALLGLDSLLAYYKQNYQLYDSDPCSDFDGVQSSCNSIQELRMAIIDSNLRMDEVYGR